MKVTIHGPNLADQSGGQFIVHAVGCRDNRRVKSQTGTPSQGMSIEVSSREDVAMACYEDQIDGGECDIEVALADFKFCPCCKDIK